METLVLGLVVVPLLALCTAESDFVSCHVYLSLSGLAVPEDFAAYVVIPGYRFGCTPTETYTYSSISVTT
ncbi:uncharacterized protein METZ01_LOCUS118969, partial [marine metagenome]